MKFHPPNPPMFFTAKVLCYTVFSKPIPPYKLPTKSEKNSGRVLTSSEALKALQEKEEKKSATEKQKELRHKKKENKKLLKRNNDIKENVEENVKIKVNQGTQNENLFS